VCTQISNTLSRNHTRLSHIQAILGPYKNTPSTSKAKTQNVFNSENSSPHHRLPDVSPKCMILSIPKSNPSLSLQHILPKVFPERCVIPEKSMFIQGLPLPGPRPPPSLGSSLYSAVRSRRQNRIFVRFRFRARSWRLFHHPSTRSWR
jgi:hypothetical protein